MKTQTNVTNKKTQVKKNDTFSDENSQINSVSFMSARPSSQPEAKQGNSKQKATFFYLTDKELAIITSLSKGNSYKMIATDCNITINTVREHIRNIYQKLKVHSSIEAVLLALKENLIFASFFQSFDLSFLWNLIA